MHLLSVDEAGLAKPTNYKYPYGLFEKFNAAVDQTCTMRRINCISANKTVSDLKVNSIRKCSLQVMPQYLN